jgi:hypothetical protein
MHHMHAVGCKADTDGCARRTLKWLKNGRLMYCVESVGGQQHAGFHTPAQLYYSI